MSSLLDQQAESLKQANDQLREELNMLKSKVERLREDRFSVENPLSFDDREEDLLRLENELLRGQLREQQEFLRGCRLLMFPQPVDVDKTRLVHQGGENTLTQLFLLVSKSQIAADWQAVQLPTHCFSASAVPGLNVTCNFRKEIQNETSSLTLRVDGCFPGLSPAAVAQVYWSTWTSASAFAHVFHGFFNDALGVNTDTEEEGVCKGITPLPFLVKPLMQFKEGDEETKVNMYREYARDGTTQECVYCATKVKREIALSTLSMASELNPSVASRRAQHSKRINHGPAKKRGKGCESASQLVGKKECIVLARGTMNSSTQFHQGEGLFVWQDEISVDVEVGEEIVRKKVPATRAVSFVSFSNDLPLVQDTQMFSAVVDASGKATEKYARLINAYYSLMSSASEF